MLARVLGLFLCLVLLCSCTPSVPEDTPLRIGALLVLSGDGASWGQASHNAIQMAVEEVNANGGIHGRQVEVIYEDTQGDASLAVASYRKLVDVDEVLVIVGPNFQTEVGAIAPIASAEGFPVVSPSYATLDVRPDPRNPLLLWLDPEWEAKRLAKYMYDGGIRTVGVIGTEDSWERLVSTSFAESFREHGGVVTSFELLQPDAISSSTAVAKAIDQSPEAIFIGSYYQFLNTRRSLQEMGFVGKTYSIEIDEYLAQESASYSTGTQFIAPDTVLEDFQKRYETRWGTRSTIPAGQTYDAMMVLFDALRADPSSSGLLEYFREFHQYSGASGLIIMDEQHRTLLPTAIYELKNGSVIRLESVG